MASIGNWIDETGTLIRDGGGFALRRDVGGRYRLDLHRVPIDEIEKGSGSSARLWRRD